MSNKAENSSVDAVAGRILCLEYLVEYRKGLLGVGEGLRMPAGTVRALCRHLSTNLCLDHNRGEHLPAQIIPVIAHALHKLRVSLAH